MVLMPAPIPKHRSLIIVLTAITRHCGGDVLHTVRGDGDDEDHQDDIAPVMVVIPRAHFRLRGSVATNGDSHRIGLSDCMSRTGSR